MLILYPVTDPYMKGSSMKSIAIALKSSSSQADQEFPKVELHLNIWKLNDGFPRFHTRFFLDVGLMADCVYDEICFYLPFSLRKKHEWQDLGEIICNDNNLLCAIFNDDLRAIPLTNNCFYSIERNSPDNPADNKCLFSFYTLGSNNVTVDEDKENKGTWLHVKIEDAMKISAECKRFYIRFRLFIKDNKQFIDKRHISNDLIQAAFSNLDLYDMRINELRNLDKKIREKFRVNHYILSRFSKFHSFFIANTKVSVETSSDVKSDSRIIEPSVWNSYEPLKINDKLFIAHHWKMKPADDSVLKSMNLFFTAKYPRIQTATLAAYFSIIVILGAVGSWLSTMLPSGPYKDGDVSLPKIVTASAMGLAILWHLLRKVRAQVRIWLAD